NEAAVHDAAIDGLRWRQFYAAGGAGLMLALAVLLLTPVPEKEVDVLTAMRALTETPGSARRAEAAPAATRTPAVDDIPDLNAVVAATGRRPETLAGAEGTSGGNAVGAEGQFDAYPPAADAGAAPSVAAALVDLTGAAKVCADMARVLDTSDLP